MSYKHDAMSVSMTTPACTCFVALPRLTMATGQMTCGTVRLGCAKERGSKMVIFKVNMIINYWILQNLIFGENMTNHDKPLFRSIQQILCSRGRWALVMVPNTAAAGSMMLDMAMDPTGRAWQHLSA